MVFRFGSNKKKIQEGSDLTPSSEDAFVPAIGWLAHMEILLGLPANSLKGDMDSMMNALDLAEEIADDIVSKACVWRNNKILQVSPNAPMDYKVAYDREEKEFNRKDQEVFDQCMLEIAEIERNVMKELESLYDVKNTHFDETIAMLVDGVCTVDLTLSQSALHGLRNTEHKLKVAQISEKPEVSFEEPAAATAPFGNFLMQMFETTTTTTPALPDLPSREETLKEAKKFEAELKRNGFCTRFVANVGEDGMAGAAERKSRMLQLQKEIGALVGVGDIAEWAEEQEAQKETEEGERNPFGNKIGW